jgi:monoamine oxidase
LTSASWDVVIIGAGAAGLSAARELSLAQKRVLLLEGRARVGGRIYTYHTATYPVEMGAEFIHGRPPEICNLAQAAGLRLAEAEWHALHRKGKRWVDAGETMSGMYRVFGMMSASEPERSFQEFLDQVDAEPESKEQALRFVEGFHAADPRRISVHWLVKSNAADEQIDGSRQFRFADGYDALIKSLLDSIDWAWCQLQLDSAVTQINWRPGEAVAISVSGAQFCATRILVTVPLGVLKSGGIRFQPALAEKEKALQGLEMGPAVRASLCFRHRFWEDQPQFQNVSFILSDDPHFPTWWTSNPLPFPIFTGWAAGHHARDLGNLSSEQLIQRAIESLASILEMDSSHLREELETGFTYDWQRDQFSFGAYTYTVVGGTNAGSELAAPVARTLFFAGEATNADGHNGTVHGAIASGVRAAQAVLNSW